LENQLFYGTNLSTNFTCAKWATKGHRVVANLERYWVMLWNFIYSVYWYLAPELKLFTHETMIAIEHVVHYDSWVSKCYYRWMAWIIKMVAQQYYKFPTRILLNLHVIGYWLAYIVGNIEVLVLYYIQITFIFRLY
jgi:hypothetical protein